MTSYSSESVNAGVKVQSVSPDAAARGIPAGGGTDLQSGTAPPEASVLGFANVVLRRWRVVAVSVVLFVGYTVFAAFTAPVTWSSEALLMPENSGSPSPLSNIPVQFGGSMGSEEGMQSPQFYAELLRSRAILQRVAQQPVAAGSPPRMKTVADLYGIRATSPRQRAHQTTAALMGSIASATTRTGAVQLRVSAPDALAAKSISDRLLAEIMRFNMQTRQSQAAAERRFIEERLRNASEELRAAESRLEDFLQRNRVAESPELTVARQRLERHVRLREEIHTSLATSYERARIDEVRDTPLLTVIEPPEVPVAPDARGGMSRIIVAFITGGLIGIVLAHLIDFLTARLGATPAERAQFDARIRRLPFLRRLRA